MIEMAKAKSSDRDLFEGFVTSIEDWARKHNHNVHVAVNEHKEIKEPIVSEIRKVGALSILDVGTGYGFLMSRLNQVSCNSTITGTDISRFQVINAKLRKVKGFLVVCCAEYMPFKSDFFDFVVCSEVIEHTVSPSRALLEIERMLKENHYFCVSTDNPLSICRKIINLAFKVTQRKKRVKEEFISLASLTQMIPSTIRIYKLIYTCPYTLLPAVGLFRSEAIGRVWVSLAKKLENIPYIGKQFCNKYAVFGIKQLSSKDKNVLTRERLVQGFCKSCTNVV
jgi:ubiquinone/menaquinone biosynthesis C-methylase UbiE